jgi:hypothetical protein
MREVSHYPLKVPLLLLLQRQNFEMNFGSDNQATAAGFVPSGQCRKAKEKYIQETGQHRIDRGK